MTCAFFDVTRIIASNPQPYKKDASGRRGKRNLQLFEITLVLVRLGHVGSRIVNASQSIAKVTAS